MARLAKSLEILREQISWEAPDRNKRSDGWVGDARHRKQNPSSDHNPNSKGVVRAIDITHDPEGGCDSDLIAERLLATRDLRLKYVIWNRRMFSYYPKNKTKPFTWRKYSGSNPHTRHIHISVKPDPKFYDLTRKWDRFWFNPQNPTKTVRETDMGEKPPLNAGQLVDPRSHRIGRNNKNSVAVTRVQDLLLAWDENSLPRWGADGDYGNETVNAVKRFQRYRKLTANGTADMVTLYYLIAENPQ